MQPASGVGLDGRGDDGDTSSLPPLFFPVVPDTFIDRIEAVAATALAYAAGEDGEDDGCPPLGWDRWSF
jgi:hypothetical protein